jgi:sugar lactone lactonase YvrE
VYLTDWTKCRVEKLSPSGHLLMTFGSFTDCTNAEAPHGPYGIALDSDQNVWVSDAGTAKVTEFSPTGQVLRTWGKPGVDPGELTSITSIGISPKGEVAVSDVANHAVQFFTPDGAYLRSVGRQGEEPGQFLNYFFTLAFDAQDNLYVADHTGGQVQIFSPDGTILKVYGQGQLGTRVNGLALTGDGAIYAQAAGRGIVKISPSGQISLFAPNVLGQGIAVDPSGNVWASDQGDDSSVSSTLDEFSPDGKHLQSFSQPVS